MQMFLRKKKKWLLNVVVNLNNQINTHFTKDFRGEEHT